MHVYQTSGERLALAPFVGADRAEYIRAEIAAGVAKFYRAPMFLRGFDDYVCVGDTIRCEYQGFTISARIEFDSDSHIDDTDCFPTEFDPEMFGEDNEENRANFERALDARHAWERDEWFYCGVVLSVSREGIVIDEHAASLWGIEANFPASEWTQARPNAHLTNVACELAAEAIRNARAALELLTDGMREPELDKAAKLRAFVESIAAMRTESEHGENGMSGDDAVGELSSLIDQARELLRD